jgi:hypothetical protein
MDPMAALRLRQYLRVPLATADAAQQVNELLAAHGIVPAQQVQAPGTLAMLTHETEEWRAAGAVRALTQHSAVCHEPVRMRVEALA